jgi:hypothetical protein
LVLELDLRDFDAVVRQKTAALASSQAQAGATQAALQEAIAHIKTEQATVESDQATAAAALTPQVGSSAAHHQSYGLIYQTLQQQASLWSYVDLFRMLVIVCLACVPLVFLFKKPKGAVPPGELAAAH